MGSLALPASGLIYTDSDIVIYSVETYRAIGHTLDSGSAFAAFSGHV